MITKWEYQGTYLEQFPINYRGAFGNLFCTPARMEGATVASILRWVKQYIRDQHQAEYDGEQGDAYRLLNDSLSQDEAAEFAYFILERDRLPREIKDKLKREKQEADTLKRWESAPATEKQLAYIRALGGQIAPKTMAEASEMINKLKP